MMYKFIPKLSVRLKSTFITIFFGEKSFWILNFGVIVNLVYTF